MKCPHCSTNVSMFSNEMNKNSSERRCPHCGGDVKLGINLPVAIAVMNVFIVAWTFVSTFLDARIGILIAIIVIACFQRFSKSNICSAKESI